MHASQVIGGTGFIVSSLLFMLETQKKWWLPAPKVLGWHIGFWNFIGALGFTACGAVGFGGTRDAIQYASTLSTFIGSWAFLVSVLLIPLLAEAGRLIYSRLVFLDRQSHPVV